MRFFLSIVMVLFISLPAFAQSYMEMYEQVSTMNRVQPLQNPTYKRTYEILNRKVQDRKTRVVGGVKDVLISKFGPVEALNIDLDRLRLGTIVINTQETGIEATRDSYVFANYDEEGIKDLYPALLGNIQTAAGSDQDVVSLQKLLGAAVKTSSGDTIGRIEDVLFNSSGNVVEALYIGMKYGTARGDIAVPFGAADYSKLSSNNEVILFDEQVKAMSDYLGKK